MHVPSEIKTDQIHTLDARGCLCPQPLIKTRRLWKTLSAGEAFQVLVDNDIAHMNLVAFLDDQGASPEVSQEGEDWIISAMRSGEAAQATTTSTPTQRLPTFRQAATPDKPSEQLSDYVVVLNSAHMGQGDNELGSLLIKGYLNTLKELDHKPGSIILYNGGAQLAEHNSGADTALKALEDASVDVMVCGACVDFFDMRERLAAGRITNMYDIAEKIAQTGHVVYP